MPLEILLKGHIALHPATLSAEEWGQPRPQRECTKHRGGGLSGGAMAEMGLSLGGCMKNASTYVLNIQIYTSIDL